jgi:hypothetical protein
MTGSETDLSDLYLKLGYKRLNRAWAKVEIVLGLVAAGLGLFLGEWSLSQPKSDVPWSVVAGGLCLFVLGSYLALAGHRSHLYQSSNALTAHLVQEIRRLKEKVEMR